MSQIKLSYKVGQDLDDKVEVICHSHIELAEQILNMERDVGMICYNVEITTGCFQEHRRINHKLALQNIQRWAKLLEKHAK